MIKMYRDLLHNRTFVKKIEDEIVNNKSNNQLWSDYTQNVDGDVFMQMDMSSILRNIRDTLNRWEDYGYQHFTRDGKCKNT